MDRKQLFEYIITHNLKEEVKAKFGKPYNSVSTELLQGFIDLVEQAKELKTMSTPANFDTMNYKELKEFVKENNLQDFAKSLYGKNYTNLSTEELRYVCMKYSKAIIAPTDLVTGEFVDSRSKVECTVDSPERRVLKALCTILNQKDLLKLLN